MVSTHIASAPSTRAFRRFAALCFVGMLAALSTACMNAPRNAARQHAQSMQQQRVAAQRQATDYWQGRIEGAWSRVDAEGSSPATAAEQLVFEGTLLHERWLDDQRWQSEWRLRDASSDVAFLAVSTASAAPQVWRLFLADEDTLTLFKPGHGAADYLREGSAKLTAYRLDRAQEQKSRPVSGVIRSEHHLAPPAHAQNVTPAQETPSDEVSSSPVPRVQSPAGEAASVSPAAASDEQAYRDALAELTLQQFENEPMERLPASFLEAVGAPSGEELARQVRSVGVAHAWSDRKLGERLLIGTWDFVAFSDPDASDEEDEGTFHDDDSRSMRLQLRPDGSATLSTVVEERSYQERGVWAFEGMYGPEVRVIITWLGDSPRRERFLYLDIDRFILSPEDGAVLFERHRP